MGAKEIVSLMKAHERIDLLEQQIAWLLSQVAKLQKAAPKKDVADAR